MLTTTAVATWTSARGGSYFILTRTEGDGLPMTYGYRSSGGSGAGFTFPDDDAAIAYAERRFVPFAQPDKNVTPMRRNDGARDCSICRGVHGREIEHAAE